MRLAVRAWLRERCADAYSGDHARSEPVRSTFSANSERAQASVYGWPLMMLLFLYLLRLRLLLLLLLLQYVVVGINC